MRAEWAFFHLPQQQQFLRDRGRSIIYCRKRFAHYGFFARLPLITTFIIAGDFKSELSEELNPSSPRWPSRKSRRWEDAVKNFDFEGHEFFTYDDYDLFFCLTAACLPVTEAQLEADRHELVTEAKNPRRIVKAHAESLLKAIDFWKLWYNEKYDEWKRRYKEAFHRMWKGDEQEDSVERRDSQEDEGFHEDEDFHEDEGFHEDENFHEDADDYSNRYSSD